MTQRHTEHAAQVVERFKSMLSDDERSALADTHYGELALLIESAISSSVLTEMEKAADALDKVAHKMRDQAEHFD